MAISRGKQVLQFKRVWHLCVSMSDIFFSGTYVSRWAGCRAAGGILVPYHAAGQILSAPAPGATEFYRPLTRTTTFLKTTWRFSGSNCSCGGWFMDVSGGLTYPLRYIEFFLLKNTL